MYNYDEYMRAIIGESPTNINRYPLQTKVFNTYNRQDINIPEPTLDTINLYPDIFLTLNPIIENRCKDINSRPTKELVSQLVEEIYAKTDNKGNRSFLRDLIRILILNQLLRKRRENRLIPESNNIPPRFRQTNPNRQYLKF